MKLCGIVENILSKIFIQKKFEICRKFSTLEPFSTLSGHFFYPFLHTPSGEYRYFSVLVLALMDSYKPSLQKL